MKRWVGILVAILAVTVTADLAFAQRRPGGEGGRPGEGGEGGRPGRPGGEGGRPGEGGGRFGGPGGGRGFSFPPSPLQAALDADNDGVISAKEIENAVAALRGLDKNKDGKLDRDELRPARPSFGGRPGEGRGPGEGGPGAGNRPSMVDRLLAYDKNKDGKISKEEAPEFLKQRFDSLDTDKNGSIEKKEIEAMVARFSAGRGRGGQGGRPGEGGRPGGEGGRPRRPGGEAGGRPERPEGGGDRPRRPRGDDA